MVKWKICTVVGLVWLQYSEKYTHVLMHIIYLYTCTYTMYNLIVINVTSFQCCMSIKDRDLYALHRINIDICIPD